MSGPFLRFYKPLLPSEMASLMSKKPNIPCETKRLSYFGRRNRYQYPPAANKTRTAPAAMSSELGEI